MNFQEGETVMHWTYGLGTVVRLEERDLSGKVASYYAVQIGDLMVWVPADDHLAKRLRPPTPKSQFKEIISRLSKPGDKLPDDRNLRKNILMGWLREGTIESLCKVIRSLVTYRKTRSWNDNDQGIMRQAQHILVSEWGHALSISPAQAESELLTLLTPR